MQAVATQQGAGRRSRFLPSDTRSKGCHGRFGGRAESLPRVAERSYLDVGARNLVQQRANLRGVRAAGGHAAHGVAGFEASVLSEGIVTISPPAMSCASRAIS